MTGLEKMKSQILQEAALTAKENLRMAREEAAHIVEEAQKEAKEEEERIHIRSQEEITAHRERIEAAKKFTRRTKLLAAKQEMIGAVLGQAYDAVRDMKDAPYFEMLTKMLRKYVQPREGKLYLSGEDYAKLPRDFREQTERIAAEKDGKLHVLADGRSIDKGFILVYDGIEENCTIRAMFEARREELSDTVQQILFP